MAGTFRGRFGVTAVLASLVFCSAASGAEFDRAAFERLEVRELSGSAPVQARGLPGNDAARPGRRNVAAQLRAAAQAHAQGRPDWAGAAGLDPAQVRGDSVRIEVLHPAAGRAAVLAALTALGFEAGNADAAGPLVGWLPVANLDAAAATTGVGAIRAARKAIPQVGASLTQGVAAGNAARWHSAGIDGTGIRIAIIDGFNDTAGQVAALQASGDWPPNARLTLVSMHGGAFGENGSDHGMATLEIAHDVAPNASFVAFDTVFVSEWAQAIRDAVDIHDVDVISASLGAPLDGIGDGTAFPGSVAEAAEYAQSQGVLVINAAGNERESHWGGLFAGDGVSPGAGYTDSHLFNGAGTGVGCLGPAGTNFCYCIPANFQLAPITLHWDDWTNVDQDYDLRLMRRHTDGSWAEVDISDFPQDGTPGQSPQEFIQHTTGNIPNPFDFCGTNPNTTFFGVSIVRRTGNTGGHNLQLFTGFPFRLNVPARSLGFPGDSPALVTVAALDVGSSVQESYSSEGPVLAPGGGLPAGGEPLKPDVASFANVDTESYGAGIFNGTSSATPHVAGMAALLLQRKGGPGSVTPQELQQALREVAAAGSNDLGSAGDDFQHGSGRERFQTEDALAFEDQPSDTVAGAAIAPPISVSVRDDEGELVLHGLVDDVDLALTDDPSAGAATLSGATDAAVVDGLAEFPAASIDVAGVGYSVTASATTIGAEALSSPESDPFDIQVNVAPVAVADLATVAEGGTLNVSAALGVLANDSDANNTPLTAVLDTTTTNGALTLNADGSYSYVHDDSETTSDSFTYHANDGGLDSNVVTVSITVTPVNDNAPVAVADSGTVAEGGTLNVNAAAGVLANDTDVDGSALTAVLDTTTNNGALTLNADGSYDYVHDGSETTSDSFTYHANDGVANSNVVTVSITVTPVNDNAPVALADAGTVAEGGTLNLNAAAGVLANDTDVDNSPLTAVLDTTTTNGALTLNADGSYDYVHDGSETTSDSFTYHANDGVANSNVVTVSITVTPVNDNAPVAVGEGATVAEGGTLTVSAPGVLSNDTDADGSVLTAVLDTTTTNGTLTLNADGSYTYVHDDSETTSDFFTYHANDGVADSNVVTVDISVTPVNDNAPVAVGEGATVAEGGTLNVAAPGVLSNETDADGSALTAVLDTTTTNGALTLNADGSYSYVHDGSETISDSFTYHANDGVADSNIVTVSIGVTPVNDNAPVAVADTGTVAEGGTLTVDAAAGVLANDTDADGSALTAVLDTTTSNGVLTLDADGSYSYVHDGGETTSDSFTYHANDGIANSNVVTVSITVTPVNDAPAFTGEPYSFLVTEGAAPGAAVGSVAATDVDGDTLTFSLTAGNTGAAFAIDPASGAITVATPAALTAGAVFTLTVRTADPGGLDDTTTVTVNVQAGGPVDPFIFRDGFETPPPG